MAQWLDRVKYGSGKSGSPAVTGTINTYATCTGTATELSLATALSASLGDVILIHQSQGTGAGQWEINYVLADVGATLTLAYPLAYTYGTGAQAVLVPQYTGGTISGGITGTDWGGSVGGIIALMSNGDLVNAGSITINGGNGSSFSQNNTRAGGGVGGGFRGGNGYCAGGGGGTANQGESIIGGLGEDYNRSSNGAGGGSGGDYGNGGGGANGANGGDGNGGSTAQGGFAVGNAGLTLMTFGGGGGGSVKNYSNPVGGGGAGAGILFIIAKSFNTSGGTISLVGGNGASNGSVGGGSGAGGSCLIKTQIAVLGTNKILATAGSVSSSQGTPGTGGVGRIHIDYSDTITGTTTPTLDSAQVTTLKLQVYGGMV